MKNSFAGEDDWRKNVISAGFEFVNLIWTPTEKNLYHGNDKDGVLVNTPNAGYSSEKYPTCGWWRTNESNRGMPYKWGGRCTVDEFQTGISKGKFAGSIVDYPKKGKSTSKHCVGVDCSGLVSVCWGLQEKYDTSDLPDVSSKLETIDSLLSGDILLSLTRKHVMIFVAFTNIKKTFAIIIEASRQSGKVSSRVINVAELLSKDYLGYSYNKKHVHNTYST